MNISFIAVLLVILTISCPANGQDNFVIHHLSHGDSIELPRSWAITTEHNQDFNEFGQAGYDVAKENVTSIPNGNIKTELFATKVFGHAVASVLVSFIETPASTNDVQMQLSKMGGSDKTILANTIKSSLVSSKNAPPDVTVTIEKRGKFFVFVSNWVSKGNKLDKETIVQIPLNARILQIQFRCQLKNQKIWQTVFDKIVLSVQTKNK